MFKDPNDMQEIIEEGNAAPTSQKKKVQFKDPIDDQQLHTTKVRPMQAHPQPGPTDNVLIIDSAADQSCVGQGFRILHYTGASIHLDGALDTMGGGTYPLVCAATVVVDPTSTREVIIIINQAAYNPSLSQHESLLLHTDQARHHGVQINDLASYFVDRYGNPGAQNIEVDGHTLTLKHDGLKYFLNIREPTTEEWNTLPLIELTSPLEWLGSHHHVRRSKRQQECSPDKLEEWRCRFGNIPPMSCAAPLRIPPS